ncbi:MAG: Xaa-Pro aminopeptidase [Pseudomonadota bacterium]|nr:Xaa-Pro aminopeptidase [Pseudomonadota bacterium]
MGRQYEKRRQRLIDALPEQSLVIMVGEIQKKRSADQYFPFWQAGDFYYLTGWEEPNAVMVLAKDKKKQQSLLFHKGHDALDSKWHGENISHQKAEDEYHFEQALSTEVFLQWLENNQERYQRVFMMEEDSNRKWQVALGENKIDQKWLPQQLMRMRIKKDEQELSHIKKACQITANAHNEIIKMNARKQFEYEYEIAASFHYQCMIQGATGLAYESIVAGGQNACILHYTKNRAKIEKDVCVLIDAGCSVSHYCADVSRTWPVFGKFTSEQKAVYELVLAVQRDIIKNSLPGTSMKALQQQSRDQLLDGLMQMGIVDTKADKEALFSECYGHGIGHSLGLDVHDPSPAKSDFILEKDMVITIEPGVYLRDSTLLKDKRFQGIGVRIEDNIWLREGGNKNLTAAAEVDPQTVESMASG